MGTFKYELRLDGEVILKGDEVSIAVVYNNLVGKNFEPPQPVWREGSYEQYVAYMQETLGVALAGRVLSYGAPGQEDARFQFPLPVCSAHPRAPMVRRPDERQTEDQRWCGVWYDCATPGCRNSALVPSREHIAAHGEHARTGGDRR